MRYLWDRQFTAGLFVGALVALFTLVRFHAIFGGFLLRFGDSAAPWLASLLVLFLLAALLPAVLRAAGARAAFRVTKVCCTILLFWFPVGTGLFVWWLLFLHDREEFLLDHPAHHSGIPWPPRPRDPKIGPSARPPAGEDQGDEP